MGTSRYYRVRTYLEELDGVVVLDRLRLGDQLLDLVFVQRDVLVVECVVGAEVLCRGKSQKDSGSVLHVSQIQGAAQ